MGEAPTIGFFQPHFHKAFLTLRSAISKVPLTRLFTSFLLASITRLQVAISSFVRIRYPAGESE